MGVRLWERKAAAAATGGAALGAWDGFDRIAFDSRQAGPGALFAALADKRDGHDFIADALAKGATAALASRRPEGSPPDAPLLLVRDVVGALADLGRAARARNPGLWRIAVTGSAGKTTTKEMLRAALTPFGPVHAAEKSYNNHWGVPLTLAQTPQGAAFGVYEIGMNHAGEITPLSQLVAPHVAVATTVAPAHLAAFASEEGIAEAKAEIFAGLVPGGVAVLNRDNRWFDLLSARAAAAGARIIAFGADPAADARLIDAAADSEDDGRQIVDAVIHGRPVRYALRAPGVHQALNSLAVLASVDAAGGDVVQAAAALSVWTPPEGRGRRRRVLLPGADTPTLFIDEAYNANPASLRAALAVLGAAPVAVGGRRIAVIGDMLELGEQSQDLHAEIAKDPAWAAISLIFACGTDVKALFDAMPVEKRGLWAHDSDALSCALQTAVRSGDAVMAKGSAGMRMIRAVQFLHDAPDAPPIMSTDAPPITPPITPTE